jgi:hypothetical protein
MIYNRYTDEGRCILDAVGSTAPAGAWHTGAVSAEYHGFEPSANRDNESSTEADWILIHEGLLKLAGQQAELDYEQGRLLLAALREGVPARLGYSGMVEYSEILFGHKPRQTGERLRVAEALEELPAMAKALRTRQLCWSVIRELSRVATAETEGEWLEAAEGKTARDVEQAVSGKEKGQRPSDPADPKVKTHRLSFEVSSEALAMFKDAVDKLRRDTGEPLTESEALLLLARRELGGPGDEGRSTYQVAMTVCEHCGQGFQQVCGELLPVSAEVTEAALCDAQHIGRVADGPGSGQAGHDEHVVEADPEGAGSDDAHVGTGVPPNEHKGETHVGTGKQPPSAVIPVRPPTRARQAIPPAVGRAVRHRQKGRCAVPGCRGGSTYFELHHLRYRHDGKCEPDQIIGLCWPHHRRVHAGLLIIDGASSKELQFYHADGSQYGRSVSAPALAVREQALRALTGLGFQEKQAKLALSQVCLQAGGRPTLEEVFRKALASLTPTPQASGKRAEGLPHETG